MRDAVRENLTFAGRNDRVLAREAMRDRIK